MLIRVLFLLLLSGGVYCQKLVKGSYERKMDSIGLIRLTESFSGPIKIVKDDGVKIRLHGQLNSEDVNVDYLIHLGNYHIRDGFYLINTCLLTGTRYDKYSFQSGFILTHW